MPYPYQGAAGVRPAGGESAQCEPPWGTDGPLQTGSCLLTPLILLSPQPRATVPAGEVLGPAVAAGPGRLFDDDLAYIASREFDPCADDRGGPPAAWRPGPSNTQPQVSGSRTTARRSGCGCAQRTDISLISALARPPWKVRGALCPLTCLSAMLMRVPVER